MVPSEDIVGAPTLQAARLWVGPAVRLFGAEHRKNRGSVRVSGQAKERFMRWRVQRPSHKSTRSVPSILRSAGDPEAQRRGAKVKRRRPHPQPCARCGRSL